MEKERIIWLDYVRCFACLSVVLLHASAPYVMNMYNEKYDNWVFGNFIDSFVRGCVPLFFMISGYIFLSEHSPRKKHIIKLFSALIFYSLIGWIANFFFYYLFRDQIKFPNASILNAPIFYHLWFFYTLIPVYIILMMIKSRAVSFKTVLILSIVVFVILNPRTNDLTKLLFNMDIKHEFMFGNLFIGCLLFSIVGGMLNGVKINNINEKLKYIPFILFVISSLSISFLTIKISEINGKSTTIFYGYTTPLVAISSISIFIFFFLKPSWVKENRFVSLISRYSLGIYGFHAVILFFIKNYTEFYKGNYIIWFPFVFLLTVVISMLLTYIIKLFDKKGYIS